MNPAGLLAAAATFTVLAGGELGRWVHRTRVVRRVPEAAAGPPPGPAPRLRAPGWLAAALARAGLGDPDRLVTAWVATVTTTAAVAVVVPVARILLVVTLVGPFVAVAALGDRTARRRRRQLPDALDGVAAALRGGAALPRAIAAATDVGPPVGRELAAVARAVDAGQPVADALTQWASARPDAHTAIAAAALGVAAEVGGPGARAIDGAAASLRDRLDAEAEATALATQGRVSALVLTLVPVVFAVLLSGLDGRAAHFLFSTPAGWLCIGLGLGLDGLGAWWMARLVRRAR